MNKNQPKIGIVSETGPLAGVSLNDQEMLDYIIELVIACKLKQANKLLNKLHLKATVCGVNLAILGCTELSLALKDLSFNRLQIINSNYILAESLADEYYKQNLTSG